MKQGSPRIYFFAPFCILRNSTNRIFDMRVCDSLSGAGCEVILTFPYLYMKENLKRDEIFSAYGSKNNFALRMLWTPLTSRTPDTIRNLILLIAYSFSALWVFIANAGRLKNVIVVSRETIPLVPILLLKKIFGKLFPARVVIQLHELKKGWLHRWVYKQCSGLMPNVPIAKKILNERDHIPVEKMLVMNAPMVDFHATDCTKDEARKKINYHSTIPLVVYTGKIGMKVAELDYILEAALQLPQCHFIFTGGKDAVVKHFRTFCDQHGMKNTTFTGFFNEVNDVRYYQLAADVLVSYYTTKDHRVEFNYPQKLQEYLSTGNAIVTPDFQATREVINNSNAFFVEPDNPVALASVITEVIDNKLIAKEKGTAAIEASKKITYDSKVIEFLNFFERLK